MLRAGARRRQRRDRSPYAKDQSPPARRPQIEPYANALIEFCITRVNRNGCVIPAIPVGADEGL
jgi:hypothetical protein